MYADRRTSEGFKPASLGIALAVNGAVVAALWLASPHVITVHVDRPFKTYSVPIDPPPEPLPVPAAKPLARTMTVPPVRTPVPVIDVLTPIVPIATTADPVPAPNPSATASGVAVDPVPTATPTPVLVDASVDPRYAADLQPLYPPEETRAGREGRVVVRVLVGVDGRVKQVEPVSATSDAFFRATAQRATSRWRFRPATRDGIPVEAWRTMAIRFVLKA